MEISAYRLPPLAPRISGTGCLLLPTPNATDGSKAPKFFAGGNPSLPYAVKMLPTPKSSPSGPDFARTNRPGAGSDDLATVVARQETGGALNPQFVAWMMGFPLDWCDMPDELPEASPTESPSSDASATPSCLP